MKTQTLAIVLVAAMLPLAGCIQNMADLKERLGATTEETVEPATIDPTPEVPTPVVNTTKVTKDPVARISLFGANGALVYKATFKADDATEIIVVDEKASLNAIASDSEALEPGATLTKFAWTLDGTPVGDARQVTLAMDEPGLRTLVLSVTDSHDKTDTQSVTIGVQPPAFDMETALETGAVAGVLGAPESADVPFDLTVAAAGMPATIQGMVVTVTPDASCDVSLSVLDAEGESLGEKDSAFHPDPQTETLTLGALPEGTYTIRVTPQACPPQTAIPIKVIVTYLPTIEGLDGHGGHAH